MFRDDSVAAKTNRTVLLPSLRVRLLPLLLAAATFLTLSRKAAAENNIFSRPAVTVSLINYDTQEPVDLKNIAAGTRIGMLIEDKNPGNPDIHTVEGLSDWSGGFTASPPYFIESAHFDTIISTECVVSMTTTADNKMYMVFTPFNTPFADNFLENGLAENWVGDSSNGYSLGNGLYEIPVTAPMAMNPSTSGDKRGAVRILEGGWQPTNGTFHINSPSDQYIIIQNGVARDINGVIHTFTATYNTADGFSTVGNSPADSLLLPTETPWEGGSVHVEPNTGNDTATVVKYTVMSLGDAPPNVWNGDDYTYFPKIHLFTVQNSSQPIQFEVTMPPLIEAGLYIEGENQFSSEEGVTAVDGATWALYEDTRVAKR